MNDFLRHGDVILKVCKIPEHATVEFTGNRFVIALGEQTGHSHTLVCDKPFTTFKCAEVRYMKFDFPVTIEHQEHKPLTILPGVYRQDQEQEKDWFSLSTRKVID